MAIVKILYWQAILYIQFPDFCKFVMYSFNGGTFILFLEDFNTHKKVGKFISKAMNQQGKKVLQSYFIGERNKTKYMKLLSNIEF